LASRLDAVETWKQFAEEAPETEGVFRRRLDATGLGLLATLRRDGFPRISPVEPLVHGGQIWLGMMSRSTKSLDLARDPRCSLHSATADKDVKEGDAKLWGTARAVTDEAVIANYLSGWREVSEFDPSEAPGGFDLWQIELTGASALQLGADGEHLRITVWKPGTPERVVERR
jgi:Pyridoxamine 5'-phosphate oxidase